MPPGLQRIGAKGGLFNIKEEIVDKKLSRKIKRKQNQVDFAMLFPRYIRKKEITHSEVTNILQKAISGEIKKEDIQLPNLANWWEVSEPDVKFGSWSIQLFIEADWIYDVYRVESPDGRVSDFCPASKDSCINFFLKDNETSQLCKLLGCRR